MDEEGILENLGLLPSISFVRRLCRIEQVKKTPLVELRVPLSIARLFWNRIISISPFISEKTADASFLFLCSDVFCLFGLKGFLDKLCYFTHILSGLETCNDVAITVDQEFGEIPFYIARRTPVGIGPIKYPFKSRA